MFWDWLGQNKVYIESFLKVSIEAILIFVVGWWGAGIIARYIKKLMKKAKVDAGIISFIMSILKVVLRLIVILSVATHVGIPIAPVLTAIGAAAVTVSLALKDSLSNIASGVLIVANRMFSVGDYLKVGAFEGKVDKIELFFTTLITSDNKQVLIPNSIVTTNSVSNYTALDSRRLDLVYTVDYRSDLDKVKQTIKAVIDNEPEFMGTPSSAVEVAGYKNKGIDIAVKVWCRTESFDRLYIFLQERVKKAFDENGIQMIIN